jgi:hypothetical protein
VLVVPWSIEATNSDTVLLGVSWEDKLCWESATVHADLHEL